MERKKFSAVLVKNRLQPADCGLYFVQNRLITSQQQDKRSHMKVSDILRVKGSTLYTATPDEPLSHALDLMAERDIGSLVVMEQGKLVGMLTFREVIKTIVSNGGTLGTTTVRSAMDNIPLTCTPETDMDEVRRMMLERHARYMPVMDGKMLMGVISFYDVAKAVVDSQNFENQMLKAYIRDWPETGEASTAA
jgi:CBS domain-containing protein